MTLLARTLGCLVLLLLTAATARPSADAAPPAFDVIVFGGTSAGVMSAVAAGRAGDRVLLLEPGYLIGGMMSGGLTKTDIGKKDTIGGLSREFFQRVVSYYTRTYGETSTQARTARDTLVFEPSVAGRIFAEMLADAKVVVRTKEQLDATRVRDGAIEEIVTRHYETGARPRHTARVFVDATYEGDLMAQAGVLYRVGREARAEYHEPLAGLTEGPAEYLGAGDHRVQSFNIRGTLTTRDDIRVPVPKPTHYDPAPFEHYVQLVLDHKITTFESLFDDHERWGEINGKSDPNKADLPGVNAAYAEADYAARARIVARVQDHWLSLWWMLQNDPRLPADFKSSARRWGLPKDEYVESGHVTPQVYVRVARRMQGRYLLTQRDVQYDRFKPDTICMGSYNTDSHPIQAFWTADGLTEEGHFNGSADPYEIPYRSITPHGVRNLLVVAAVSATHVAYSSLRMEPVFMMLGEAGGLAAHLARAKGVRVQDVPIADLQARLEASGVPLTAPYRPFVDVKVLTAGPYAPGRPIDVALVERDVRAPLTTIAWNFDGSGAVQGTTPRVSWIPPGTGRFRIMLLARDGENGVALPAVKEIVVGEASAADQDTTSEGPGNNSGVGSGDADESEIADAFVEVQYLRAELKGRWKRTRGTDVEYRQRVGLLDTRGGDGSGVARFATRLPRAGRYQVAIAWPTLSNRATNVPVTIEHAGGQATLTLNQRKKDTPFAFVPVGVFRFGPDRDAAVTITNAGADGYVAIDAVRFIPRPD